MTEKNKRIRELEMERDVLCGFKSPIDYERDYRATLAEGLAA